MASRTLCALLAATIFIAAPAMAQSNNPLSPEKGLWNRPDYEAVYKAERVEENAGRELAALRLDAVAALERKDYAAADTKLRELLQRELAPLDANFLMGLTQAGLGRWSDAKRFLEIAVEKEPKRPEPKTRLGLAYAQLNNLDGVRQQRAALASLDSQCGKTCPDAKWIAEGLVVLDERLDPTRITMQVIPAAATAPAATPVANAGPFIPVEIDPGKYNIVAFQDQHDLYDLLTKDGRCPPKKLADPRQPCALILYVPKGEARAGRAANFKPVFGVVSRKTIWAIHDKKLQKVQVEDLYFDNDDVIGDKGAMYTSIAIIGNAENKANCAKGLPCLSSLVAQDMFAMYGNMPDSVVGVIWGEGMKDVGTVRIR
ncbi:MAG: hypothetical protein QM773_03010 [Hyphomonadaceae bacterium]